MHRIFERALPAAILVAAVACSENPNTPDDSIDPPPGMLVSNAITVASQTNPIAYLSAVPGTLPGAASISLSNKTRPAAPLTVSVAAGGFDPVGIEARSGDLLSIAVSGESGGKTVMAVQVPPRRAPAIVRTSPAEGQTDGGINAHVVVVFSEPVESSSVTPTSLELSRGGLRVEGVVSVSADRLSLKFIPDNSLDPNTTYQLTLDPAIRDLDGEPLSETAAVRFTTSGPAQSAAIEVTVTTSGPDQDADGYSLSATSLSKHQFARLSANDAQTLSGTEPGNVSVVLYGLTPNCSMTGPNPRVVHVPVGGTARISYVVNCVASGSLRVTTVTTGVETDASGYNMYQLDRGQIVSDLSHSFTLGLDRGLSPNGTLTADALRPGTYVVAISDVAPNCKAATAPTQPITIVAGAETSLHFQVSCVEPTQIAFVRGAGWNDLDTANTDIYVVRSNGTGTIQLTSQPGADLNPAWSPDGSRIAFASDRAGNREIYTMNADGSDPKRLTNHTASDHLPAYSPDGKRIAFVSQRDGNAGIYVMNADGTNQVRLTSSAGGDTDPAWSPDGTRIAFSRGGTIYLINSSGGSETRVTFTAVNSQPAWSPDGSTIAFLSEGRDQLPAVYLMNPDGSAVRRILGVGYYPSSPAWSEDGAHVAFDDWDCWDYGPCPRAIVIGTLDGLYSTQIDDASEPAWRPR